MPPSFCNLHISLMSVYFFKNNFDVMNDDATPSDVTAKIYFAKK